MAWLRLDDSMGEHRKTRRLLRNGGLDAFGLHAMGLLHCARYSLDGAVDQAFVTELLDDAKVRGRRRAALIDALVESGQWVPIDGGWLIHDYLDYNPSRAQVDEKRMRDAERKARGRHTMSAGSPRGQAADGARTDAGLRDVSVRPDPTRPDPSNNQASIATPTDKASEVVDLTGKGWAA